MAMDKKKDISKTSLTCSKCGSPDIRGAGLRFILTMFLVIVAVAVGLGLITSLFAYLGWIRWSSVKFGVGLGVVWGLYQTIFNAPKVRFCRKCGAQVN
jgi:hypothetical protein